MIWKGNLNQTHEVRVKEKKKSKFYFTTDNIYKGFVILLLSIFILFLLFLIWIYKGFG